MSNTEDRIPVPTNGHHRLPSESEAFGSPDSAAATVREPADEGLDAPSPTDPIQRHRTGP